MSKQKEEKTRVGTTVEYENKKRKRRIIIWFSIVALLLGGLGFAGYQAFHQPKHQLVTAGLPKDKDAKKMNDKERSAFAQKAVDASKFQMIINPDIDVDAKTGNTNIGILNPQNNAYPTAVTITLKDGRVVYTSGGIERGYEVQSPKLDKKLKAGNYEGIATFRVYDAKTSTEKGQVSSAVNLTVK